MRTHSFTPAKCLAMLALWLLTLSAMAGDRLRICGFGNSFTEDLLWRVPELLGDDTTRVDLSFYYKSETTLESHISALQRGSQDYKLYHYIGGVWQITDVTLPQALLTTSCDVVILQQASTLSGKEVNTRQPLANLFALIRNYWPRCQMAYHMTWAYAWNSDHPYYYEYDNSQSKMYYDILHTTHALLTKLPIDYCIPSGMVIQQLRQADGADHEHDLCRDGYHLDLELGRYAVAYAFIRAVIDPILGTQHQLHIETDDQPGAAAAPAPLLQAIAEAVQGYCVDNTQLDAAIAEVLDEMDLQVYRTDYYDITGHPADETLTRQVRVVNQHQMNGSRHGHLEYIKE